MRSFYQSDLSGENDFDVCFLLLLFFCFIFNAKHKYSISTHHGNEFCQFPVLFTHYSQWAGFPKGYSCWGVL